MEDKKRILVEYPSWNPYNTPHIGNLRCYVLGNFCRKLLQFKNNKVDCEYFVNDFADPLVSSAYSEGLIKKAEVHSSILEILKEDELSYFHEVDLETTRKNLIIILSELNLLVKGNNKNFKITYEFPYGNEENLITEEGKPLYFFNDLAYGFKKGFSYDEIYTFLGEDQKKHGLNLLKISEKLGKVKRKIVLYGLVYKDNEKYSKRKGDKLEVSSFFELKREIFLFYNNQKVTTPIFNFEAEFERWKTKNKKVLFNLNDKIDLSKIQKVKCEGVHDLEVVLDKTYLELSTKFQTSPLVEKVFYYLKNKSRICCKHLGNLILQVLPIIAGCPLC